ncbi:MAG TPA: hypothetical protein PKJ63_13135 [Cyclobacteriaceae bacterium]|nr:hypothetical protein [Cyclobacteriaceae bacterium]HRX00556.1 hypothetical protein [Cyclobacteriaceae bacterium]
MKFTRLNSLTLLVLLTFGLWSCGTSTKEGNNSDEFKQAEESLQEQIEELVYNIPSPSEIPYLLEATGAEYNQSLINDRQKADQYSTRNDKAALNLGVYAADIGYLSSYGKTQEAIDYLNSAKTLADNLGVIGSFDMTVLQQFESNIANKDSLASILNRAIQKTDDYLKDDSRNKLAALMLTGSFVEGLYISTGLIKSYPKNMLPDDARNLVLTPLIRVVLEQEKSVDELLKMLSTIDQAEPVAGLVADLTSLQASYRALNIEEQIKNNRADMVLSDKNLVDISAAVAKIRNSITG